jgi:hypothetical protein
MKVFDRYGTFYTVNDPERMFAEVEIDSLLMIYESTILGHEIHSAVDKTMIEIGNEEEPKYPAAEVAEGIALLRKILVERDQEFEVEDIDVRIENYVVDVLKIKERKNEQS